MWPPSVAARAVPGEDGAQVPFAEDQDAVGEFFLGSHEPFDRGQLSPGGGLGLDEELDVSGRRARPSSVSQLRNWPRTRWSRRSEHVRDHAYRVDRRSPQGRRARPTSGIPGVALAVLESPRRLTSGARRRPACPGRHHQPAHPADHHPSPPRAPVRRQVLHLFRDWLWEPGLGELFRRAPARPARGRLDRPPDRAPTAPGSSSTTKAPSAA